MVKILYACVIEANAGWGAEVFLNESFKKLGVNTHTVDYRVNRNKLYSCFLNAPRDIDAFFLQRGDYFPIDLVECIQRPKIFYFSESVNQDADHLFRSNCFDYYFVRSHRQKNALVNRGWVPDKKISILLSAFDPKIYNYMPTNKDIDILFIGGITPRRRIMLNDLSHKLNVTVKSAYAREASHLYNRAKIVLNIHAEHVLDTETRVYEVLGSGAFLVTEPLSDESPFSNDVHLVECNFSDNDFVDRIKYYLENDVLRDSIAYQGYQFVHQHHTYDQRATQILSVINRLLAQSSPTSDAIDLKRLRAYRRKEAALNLAAYIYKTAGRVKQKASSLLG